MKNLLEQIKNDWHVWCREPEVRILEKYAEEGRQFTLLYTGEFSTFINFPVKNTEMPHYEEIFLVQNHLWNSEKKRKIICGTIFLQLM